MSRSFAGVKLFHFIHTFRQIIPMGAEVFDIPIVQILHLPDHAVPDINQIAHE